MFAGLLKAEDYPQALPYVLEYNHQVIHGLPQQDGLWTLMGKDDRVWIQTWNAPYAKPTPAEVTAMIPATHIWTTNQAANVASDIDNFSSTLKDSILALVEVMNKRLPPDKQITKPELRAAIRDEATK